MHTLMIPTVLDIFSKTKSLFCQKRTSNLFNLHMIGNMALTCRKPISQLIHFLGQEKQDWSHHYRLYSQYKWDDEKLFFPILISLRDELKDAPFLALNYDETSIPKGGKKIPGTSLLRDPHSPKFRANLKLALRCGQAALQLPLTNDNMLARSIPIDFTICPVEKKPSKKASEEEIFAYKKIAKERTFSKQALERFKHVRKLLDESGYEQKHLVIAADNAFCNSTIFNSQLDRTTILARARKDSKLCFSAKKPRANQFFDSMTFSPEKVLKDSNISWKRCWITKKGKRIRIKYKEMSNIYWRSGAGRKPLRLIVIAPLRYRKRKKEQTTDPAFLLTDNLIISVNKLIETYVNRWQIEVNHWDEKDVFGLGDAQVRSKRSVERQLRSVVFAYSVVLLAGRRYEMGRLGRPVEGMNRPKWYPEKPRWSLRDLINRLRYEIWTYPEVIDYLRIKIDMTKSILFNAY